MIPTTTQETTTMTTTLTTGFADTVAGLIGARPEIHGDGRWMSLSAEATEALARMATPHLPERCYVSERIAIALGDERYDEARADGRIKRGRNDGAWTFAAPIAVMLVTMAAVER